MFSSVPQGQYVNTPFIYICIYLHTHAGPTPTPNKCKLLRGYSASIQRGVSVWGIAGPWTKCIWLRILDSSLAAIVVVELEHQSISNRLQTDIGNYLSLHVSPPFGLCRHQLTGNNLKLAVRLFIHKFHFPAVSLA